ncbi:MAG: phospho-N-acetylmuramoyl-pentapeptide-transferase [Candidatus Poribacteria bacterium]|nr:phospho-N-acetylmuramoyl-pentapeptide-transferase [Candidatus Poribacteria bacterium]
MLYYLFFEQLTDIFSPFNVFRYITFRSIYATVTALLISLLFGPLVIRHLRRLRIGEQIREDGPEIHQSKAGTPTMGGLLIISSVLISTFLWARLDQPYIFVLVFSLAWFGGLGFLDDYAKITKQRSLGLRGWHKLLLQAIGAFVIAYYLYRWGPVPQDDLTSKTSIIIPFFKHLRPELGIWFIPFTILVIVGTSNAVNLTDGMDGLAIGCTLFVATTFGILGYLTSHQRLASYLDIAHLPISGEATTVFCAALIGAGLGFLWYNCHPAQVFMGDTGSLALGGALGTVSILIKEEMLLLLVGGLFVAEALSVIIQVWSYKTRKKRVFKMSPLHYHFLLIGWKESKVVIRFWIVGLILMLMALSTLKLR